MNVNRQLSGLILAGGESRRMGQDKGSVIWRGMSLIEHAYQTFSTLCEEIIVSSNNPDLTFRFGKIVPDNFTGIGPIAGLEAGLKVASYPLVLVMSCDTPLVPAAMFSHLLEKHGDYDISLAAHNGINEPMIGLYSKSVYPVIREEINKGQNKPPAIIKQTKWQEVDIHKGLNFFQPDMFRNLNSPEDLIV
jgi:molybdopterin-guanine dinucleotide biosynthesis protein A